MTTFFDNFVFLCDGEEDVTQIIPVEDALQQVKKQYDNVILSEENEIVLTQIALEEVSVLTDMDKATYDIKPAWCFYGTTGVAEQDFLKIVDAQTGELIK